MLVKNEEVLPKHVRLNTQVSLYYWESFSPCRGVSQNGSREEKYSELSFSGFFQEVSVKIINKLLANVKLMIKA